MIRPLLLTVVAIIVSGPKCVSADTLTTTTTVAPPTPTPYADYWMVKNEAEQVCIIFKANVTVAVKYLIDNTNLRSNFTEVDVFNASVIDDSSCTHRDEKLNETVQLLHVSFYPNGSTWDLYFYFTDNKTRNDGKAFGLYKIELKADYRSFTVPKPAANESETFTSDDKNTFGRIVGASPDHSSQCSTADLKIDEHNNAKVRLSPFAIQAYIKDKDGKLSPPELCEGDMRTSDIVPIVVGACLAALVIIVLVAYLIGRARAKRQGYASV